MIYSISSRALTSILFSSSVPTVILTQLSINGLIITPFLRSFWKASPDRYGNSTHIKFVYDFTYLSPSFRMRHTGEQPFFVFGYNTAYKALIFQSRNSGFLGNGINIKRGRSLFRYDTISAEAIPYPTLKDARPYALEKVRSTIIFGYLSKSRTDSGKYSLCIFVICFVENNNHIGRH